MGRSLKNDLDEIIAEAEKNARRCDEEEDGHISAATAADLYRSIAVLGRELRNRRDSESVADLLAEFKEDPDSIGVAPLPANRKWN